MAQRRCRLLDQKAQPKPACKECDVLVQCTESSLLPAPLAQPSDPAAFQQPLFLGK